MALTGDDYKARVTSTYRRSIYDELAKITDNIDFRDSRFSQRYKRNRSVGSAQSLIVELALTDEKFLDRLRTFMVDGGKSWFPVIHHMDRY